MQEIRLSATASKVVEPLKKQVLIQLSASLGDGGGRIRATEYGAWEDERSKTSSGRRLEKATGTPTGTP
jgi:hypothetical protein